MSTGKRRIPSQLARDLAQAEREAARFDRKGIDSVWHQIRDRLRIAAEQYQKSTPLEKPEESDNGTLHIERPGIQTR